MIAITFPTGRIIDREEVSIHVGSDVKVGDIGAIYSIANRVYQVSVPGRKYDSDPDQSFGSGAEAWVKVLKVYPEFGGGWHESTVKVVAPYQKGEWAKGGPAKANEKAKEPRETESPFFMGGKRVSEGTQTRYRDKEGKPLHLGDVVEVKYTAGRYGQTNVYTGVLLSIDNYGGLHVADSYQLEAYKNGQIRYFDKVKTKYITMEWGAGGVGFHEHHDYEHGHTTYVKIIRSVR